MDGPVKKQSDKTVGLIGLGIMGSAMTRNLVKAGFTVVGHDVLPKAMEKFVELGGKPAGSAAEVGAAAELVITSLPSAKALSNVVSDLQTLPRADRILAETSTFTLEDKTAAQQALEQAG